MSDESNELDRFRRLALDMSKVTVDWVDEAVLRVMSWMETANFRFTRTTAGRAILYQFTTAGGKLLATYHIVPVAGGGVNCHLNGTFQDNYDFRQGMLSMIETEIERIIETEQREYVDETKAGQRLLKAPVLGGAGADNWNESEFSPGLPGTFYPMGLKTMQNQDLKMSLSTLEDIWPDKDIDSLNDRLEIWKLWDEKRLLLKQIVAQVNPGESTIKRHLDALEAAGLLKRKRKKMNSK